MHTEKTREPVVIYTTGPTGTKHTPEITTGDISELPSSSASTEKQRQYFQRALLGRKFLVSVASFFRGIKAKILGEKQEPGKSGVSNSWYNEIDYSETGGVPKLYLGMIPDNLTEREIPTGSRFVSILEDFEKAHMDVSTNEKMTLVHSRDNVGMNFDEINQGVEALDKALKNEGMEPVYLHCKSGVGCSATVLAAYLVKHQGKSVDEAIRIVQRDRPDAQLKGFFGGETKHSKALRDWAKKTDHEDVPEARLGELKALSDELSDIAKFLGAIKEQHYNFKDLAKLMGVSEKDLKEIPHPPDSDFVQRFREQLKHPRLEKLRNAVSKWKKLYPSTAISKHVDIQKYFNLYREDLKDILLKQNRIRYVDQKGEDKSFVFKKEDIDKDVNFLQEELKGQLVQSWDCKSGDEYNAQVLAAYLVKHQRKSVDEAIRIVQRSRPDTQLRGFFRGETRYSEALRDWAAKEGLGELRPEVLEEVIEETINETGANDQQKEALRASKTLWEAYQVVKSFMPEGEKTRIIAAEENTELFVVEGVQQGLTLYAFLSALKNRGVGIFDKALKAQARVQVDSFSRFLGSISLSDEEQNELSQHCLDHPRFYTALKEFLSADRSSFETYKKLRDQVLSEVNGLKKLLSYRLGYTNQFYAENSLEYAAKLPENQGWDLRQNGLKQTILRFTLQLKEGEHSRVGTVDLVVDFGFLNIDKENAKKRLPQVLEALQERVKNRNKLWENIEFTEKDFLKTFLTEQQQKQLDEFLKKCDDKIDHIYAELMGFAGKPDEIKAKNRCIDSLEDQALVAIGSLSQFLGHDVLSQEDKESLKEYCLNNPQSLDAIRRFLSADKSSFKEGEVALQQLNSVIDLNKFNSELDRNLQSLLQDRLGYAVNFHTDVLQDFPEFLPEETTAGPLTRHLKNKKTFNEQSHPELQEAQKFLMSQFNDLESPYWADMGTNFIRKHAGWVLRTENGKLIAKRTFGFKDGDRVRVGSVDLDLSQLGITEENKKQRLPQILEQLQMRASNLKKDWGTLLNLEQQKTCEAFLVNCDEKIDLMRTELLGLYGTDQDIEVRMRNIDVLKEDILKQVDSYSRFLGSTGLSKEKQDVLSQHCLEHPRFYTALKEFLSADMSSFEKRNKAMVAFSGLLSELTGEYPELIRISAILQDKLGFTNQFHTDTLQDFPDITIQDLATTLKRHMNNKKTFNEQSHPELQEAQKFLMSQFKDLESPYWADMGTNFIRKHAGWVLRTENGKLIAKRTFGFKDGDRVRVGSVDLDLSQLGITEDNKQERLPWVLRALQSKATGTTEAWDTIFSNNRLPAGLLKDSEKRTCEEFLEACDRKLDLMQTELMRFAGDQENLDMPMRNVDMPLN